MSATAFRMLVRLPTSVSEVMIHEIRISKLSWVVGQLIHIHLRFSQGCLFPWKRRFTYSSTLSKRREILKRRPCWRLVFHRTSASFWKGRDFPRKNIPNCMRSWNNPTRCWSTQRLIPRTSNVSMELVMIQLWTNLIDVPPGISLWRNSQLVDHLFITFWFLENTSDHSSFNLILLDGTWPQALGLYQKNSFLHSCRSVVLTMTDSLKRFYPGDDQDDKDMKSRYVIRTQPTENSLSTVETAALCIAILENRKDVVETFLKPLEALCRFQLDNGAVSHDCKIEGGVHQKLFKSKQKKLKARIEAMVPSWCVVFMISWI